MNDLGLVGKLLPTLFVLGLRFLTGKRRSIDADQAAEWSARNLPYRARGSGSTSTVRLTFLVDLPIVVFGRQLPGRQSGKHLIECRRGLVCQAHQSY